MYNNKKIAIIGMGFLMEYIYPCYEKFLGMKNLGKNIIAVTADHRNIQSKRDRFPFKIILDDNLAALRDLKPDIILFAPPPTVAQQIIKGPLLTYFNEIRGTGIELPDIYAFPPSPKGGFYLEVLGDDVFVCNILPNMVKEINGRLLNPQVGNTYITYPENIRRSVKKDVQLREFFEPLGGIIEIPEKKIMDVLSVLVMIDLWPYRLIEIASATGADHQVIASEFNMRKELVIYAYSIENAIRKHLDDVGIDRKIVERIIKQRTKLVMNVAEKTKKEDILEKLVKNATKGGVLEKGKDLYDILLKGLTIDFFNGKSTYKTLGLIEKISYEILKIVSKHGNNLDSAVLNNKITARHHAGLFALLVRNILSSDTPEKETIIRNCVIYYAEQRGKRMAERAIKDGKDLTFETYMSYGEWKADENEIENEIINEKNPAVTRVYKCPWFSEWERLGMQKEGFYYCDNIDVNLVKGFNEYLSLEVTAVKPDNSYFCEFLWPNTDIGKKFSVEEDKRIKGWEYHISHLYRSFEKFLYSNSEILEKTKEDFTTIYGIDIGKIVDLYKNEDFSSI